MQPKRIDHLTINVVDLEKSRQFYERVLELERRDTVDMGDHVLHYYALPAGCLLELIEYRFETGACQASVTDRGMFRHLALEVESVDDMQRRCERYGFVITSPPTDVERLHFRSMLVRDPNGVELELVER